MPCVQVPTTVAGAALVDSAFVHEAHKRSIAVQVWTIDDPEEMAALLELGVDGIMTDEPATLRSVLEERGQWTEGPAAPPG